jgi:hypothetical protein
LRARRPDKECSGSFLVLAAAATSCTIDSLKIDPVAWRLRSQRLVRPTARGAADVVSWLGAMQAQDYAGAKWGIGLRAVGADDGAIERAFSDGAILRTHMMRPTWHFVTPADIRWIQKLTGPRVQSLNALYYRKAGLDAPALRRGMKVLERSLRNLRFLTRAALGHELERSGLPLQGQSLAYLMMYAELEGVVCSGPRDGKQFTYALLDERAAPVPGFSDDEALAELVRRYFTSHGPATFKDFAWWSGLTARDAAAGVAMIGRGLVHATIDGLTYWFAPGPAAVAPASPAVFLLPIYDEFGIAYRDRKLLSSVARPRHIAERDVFAHLLVIDRELAGRWRRQVQARSATIDVQPFRSLARAEIRAVNAAVEKYGTFVGLAAGRNIV